jgi:hypothetical protein
MAILALSAARELLIEGPIDSRIAALTINSATYKVLFIITYLPGSLILNNPIFAAAKKT